MPRVPLSNIDGNIIQRAMGHRPEIRDEWNRLDAVIRFTGVLDPGLKEEVRRTLALGIGCQFCSSLGDPDPGKRNRKTALAVAFAQTLFENISDLYGLDDEVFTVLRQEFTDPEVIELVCWTLFLVAEQGFGAVMKLPRATSDELNEYVDWREQGIKAAAAAA